MRRIALGFFGLVVVVAIVGAGYERLGRSRARSSPTQVITSNLIDPISSSPRCGRWSRACVAYD